MPQRVSEAFHAPPVPRRTGRRRAFAAVLVGALAATVPQAGVLASDLMPGDLMARSLPRVGGEVEPIARVARPAQRGLPVLRDLLEAPPRVSALIDLPEAPVRATVVAVAAPTRAPAAEPVVEARTPSVAVPTPSVAVAVSTVVSTFDSAASFASMSVDPTYVPNRMPVARTTVAKVAPVAARTPAAPAVEPLGQAASFADLPPPPVLFSAASQSVSDAPNSPTTVV
ncbi:MAG: hypothetical protein WCK28_10940, partial [Burkholderiales bacterium]